MDAHPIAAIFPRMTDDEQAALKTDMLRRAENGLDPLEHPILVYQDLILDGRHRWAVWKELSAEGACGGFFARNRPPLERFSPSKHGTLLAWMRAKSANMVHRHIPADQKAAIFLKAVEEFPELKAAVEEIKTENADRKKSGKPLDAGDQRGNTAKQIGKLAGVSGTTVKQVKRLKVVAPDQFEEVSRGTTTAKKALVEAAQSKRFPSAIPAKSAPKQFKPGDTFYTVSPIGLSAKDCIVRQHTVAAVEAVVYVTDENQRILKTQAFTLEEAKQERKAALAKRIQALEEEIAALKDAMGREPEIASMPKQSAS